MRFQFCGELDCPDWVLAGINLLSRISSLKLRTMCSLVMKNLIGEDLDMAKIQKMATDAKLSDSEVRAAVSVLQFVLGSAVRHSVAADQLSQELQQLGLPREHAGSLCRVLEQLREPLRSRQLQLVPREAGVAGVQWDVAAVRRSETDSWGRQLELTLQLTGGSCPQRLAGGSSPRQLRLAFSPQTAAVCLRELRLARRRMEDVS